MKYKIKNKIRKLLALSQSDNEHEAERAMTQAKSLMRKHRISTEDVDIAEVSSSVSFKRKNIRESESIILSSIKSIGGCIPFIYVKITFTKKGKAIYKSTPCFIGISTDAEISAYCWDVLYSQLIEIQSNFKKQKESQHAIEAYSIGWAIESSRKLINAFGHKDVSKSTIKYVDEKPKLMGTCRTLRTKSTGSGIVDLDLFERGMADGESANLYVATENGRSGEKKIGKM